MTVRACECAREERSHVFFFLVYLNCDGAPVRRSIPPSIPRISAIDTGMRFPDDLLLSFYRFCFAITSHIAILRTVHTRSCAPNRNAAYINVVYQITFHCIWMDIYCVLYAGQEFLTRACFARKEMIRIRCRVKFRMHGVAVINENEITEVVHY